MAPARARTSNEVGAHALGVSHELLQRLVPSLQPVADLLKAPGCRCLDLAARLAKHQPHDVFGHCTPRVVCGAWSLTPIDRGSDCAPSPKAGLSRLELARFAGRHRELARPER